MPTAELAELIGEEERRLHQSANMIATPEVPRRRAKPAPNAAHSQATDGSVPMRPGKSRGGTGPTKRGACETS